MKLRKPVTTPKPKGQTHAWKLLRETSKGKLISAHIFCGWIEYSLTKWNYPQVGSDNNQFLFVFKTRKDARKHKKHNKSLKLFKVKVPELLDSCVGYDEKYWSAHSSGWPAGTRFVKSLKIIKRA